MSGDAEMLRSYRQRAARLGALTTLLTVAFLAPYPFLRPDVAISSDVAYYLLVATALGSVALVWFLPWNRLFRGPWGMRLMYLWSVEYILIASLGVAVSGGIDSPVWVAYVLITLFFAACYPPRGQVALIGLTGGAYLVTVWITGGGSVGTLLVRIGTLVVVAVLAGFLTRELVAQMAGHRRERDVAKRRGELLSGVAAAARSVHSLVTDEVLSAVVDATAGLGFDAAGIAHVRADGASFQVLRGRGMPERWIARSSALQHGEVRTVVSSGRPLALGADRDSPLPRELVAQGVTALVVAPVRLPGGTPSVLAAARCGADGATDEEVESLELLAALAGRAMENAQLFEAERRTVERLEELDRLKSDFLATVSHEMRTPLTIVHGMADLLARHGDEVDPQRLELIYERLAANSASLTRIITSLLDLSRLDRGVLHPEPQHISISSLIAELTTRVVDLLADREIQLEVGSGLLAIADPALIERAVENLLANAATHTPPGTRIRLGCRAAGPEGSEVEVFVEDEGPGIPAEELPYVTERFYRGGGTGGSRSGGLGLGLALVSEVVALHGSQLNVVSEPGRGSRFSFRLPAPAPDVTVASTTPP